MKMSNNNKRKELHSLHRNEIIVYSIIWISGVIYSIYRVYLKSQEFLLLYDKNLIPGWTWTGLHKDDSDSEWSTYINLLPTILIPTIISIILADIVSAYSNKDVLVWFHVTTSCLFSCIFFGFWPMVFLQCQSILFYITSLSRNKFFIWITNFVILALLNNPYFNDIMFELFDITNTQYVLWCVTIAWNDLRGTSYALDAVNYYTANTHDYVHREKQDDHYLNKIKLQQLFSNNRYTLPKLIAYCGFLPTIVTGPIILYDTFENGLVTDSIEALYNKYKNLFLQMIRYIFWLLLTEFMLHFLYTNAMEIYPGWVDRLSPWEMYGYGYLLGQFFLLKYVVIYGLSGTLSKAYGIQAPNPPKCIARIHRYSDMWRFFDPGLHSFLLKYVYLPSRNICVEFIRPRLICRMLASLLCFAYIYIWHGTKQYILLWSILNYIAISIETLCDAIEASAMYQNTLNRFFSLRWQLRINSMLTCPLLAMSAISNFYFFAGLNIGNIFLKKFLFGHYTVNLTLFGFLYSACNLSHKIKIWENNRIARREKIT